MELNAAQFARDVASSAPQQAAKPVQLSPLAQMVAAQPMVDAKSPIVVAGIVRIVEFSLIAAVGVIAYFAYVFPAYGKVFDLYYIGTAFAVDTLPAASTATTLKLFVAFWLRGTLMEKPVAPPDSCCEPDTVSPLSINPSPLVSFHSSTSELASITLGFLVMMSSTRALT